MYCIFNSTQDETASLFWRIITHEHVVYYAVALGVFFSFFAYWFTQRYMGGLVRKMLEKGVGEENAVSLEEINANKFVYRYFLRNGSTLRNIISLVDGELKEIKKADESTEEAEGKEKKLSFKERAIKLLSRFKTKKYDYENAKFFISEDNEKKATDRHSRKMSGYWLPLVFVLCILCAFGMTFLFPFVMGMIRK